MAIKFCTGNILDSKMQTLTVTVNLNGVMGKGVALDFKNRYPDLLKRYQESCRFGTLKIGRLMSYKVSDSQQVLAFPTKINWWEDSQIVWISKGLNALVRQKDLLGIRSLALPMLGCGNGNLAWEEVRPMIVSRLEHLPFDIEIYGPAP